METVSCARRCEGLAKSRTTAIFNNFVASTTLIWCVMLMVTQTVYAFSPRLYSRWLRRQSPPSLINQIRTMCFAQFCLFALGLSLVPIEVMMYSFSQDRPDVIFGTTAAQTNSSILRSLSSWPMEALKKTLWNGYAPERMITFCLLPFIKCDFRKIMTKCAAAAADNV